MRSVTAKLFISLMLAHGADPVPPVAQAKSLLGGKRAVVFAGVSTLT